MRKSAYPLKLPGCRESRGPQLGDANGELVLEAAVNGQADALMTHNVRDFQAAVRLFDLRVLLPREMLKELEP